MKKLLIKLIKFVFSAFVIAVLTTGMLSYIYSNGVDLLNLSVGNQKEIITTPEPSEQPLEIVPPESEEKSQEVIMEFENTPVEFLEEILPGSTPDPSRGSNTVMETQIGGGTQVANFYVNDTSGSSLNLTEELNKELPFSLENTGEPQILIYHTHTSESYLTGFTGFYYLDYSARDTNLDRNVTVVGEALAESLESKGFSVIHDTTIHDLQYSGSYARSMETVQSYLNQYPSIEITIDVHRDSMTTESGLKYKPTVLVDGRKAAQMMLIAGSDVSGILEYENWRDNLIFNLKIQSKAEELYEGLMRPLMYSERKYNMDATNASLLLEVGTEVNTFSEARYSGQLMGNIISEVING